MFLFTTPRRCSGIKDTNQSVSGVIFSLLSENMFRFEDCRKTSPTPNPPLPQSDLCSMCRMVLRCLVEKYMNIPEKDVIWRTCCSEISTCFSALNLQMCEWVFSSELRPPVWSHWWCSQQSFLVWCIYITEFCWTDLCGCNTSPASEGSSNTSGLSRRA